MKKCTGKVRSLQQAVSQSLVNRVMPADIIKICFRDITIKTDGNRMHPVRIPVQLRAVQQPAHARYQSLGINAERTVNRMTRGKINHVVVHDPFAATACINALAEQGRINAVGVVISRRQVVSSQ